jgi:hypothetical protein
MNRKEPLRLCSGSFDEFSKLDVDAPKGVAYIPLSQFTLVAVKMYRTN